MKGNSLFKKIGAIATTTAMLASLGVTGFAATNSPSSSNANTGVTVGTPTVTSVEGKAGLYEVSVGYTVTAGATHEIGVTMLAYASTTLGESLGEGHVTSGYVHSETNPKMKIVGVDQKNASEDTDDTFTAGETGTFTFYVDTTGTYEQIQMKPGQTGIVLLSGDGAVGANGAFFSIPADEGKVSGSYSITDAIFYPSYVSDDEKKESIKESALAALGTTGVVVTVGEKAVDPDTEDTIAVTEGFARSHNTAVEETAEGVYTLVITLKSDVTTANSKYKLTTGTPIAISLTNVNVALSATDVSRADSSNLSVSKNERKEAGDLKAAMADKIVSAGLVFTDGTNSVTVNSGTNVVTVTNYVAPTTGDDDGDGYKLGDYVVTFTVNAGNYTGKNGEVSLETAKEGNTVTINYTAAGPQWACGDVDHKNGVNEFDATAILRYLAGGYDGYDYVAERTYEADTDGKNGITEFDATTILRYLAGGYPGYETLPKK